MIAVLVNTITVIIGSIIGMIFKDKIKARYSETIFCALGLCVGAIGLSSAIKTNDMLCVIICLVVGTIIGEFFKIESRLDALGDFIKSKMNLKESGTFTQGFVTASLLFCVGSMSIMGSLEAGINNDYSIIFSKSIMDGVSSVSLATGLGIGVLFSAGAVFVYQGAITLLAVILAPYLQAAVIAEMSAIGGVMLLGMTFNMIKAGKHIRLANMLPSLFLPFAYMPIAQFFSQLMS